MDGRCLRLNSSSGCVVSVLRVVMRRVKELRCEWPVRYVVCVARCAAPSFSSLMLAEVVHHECVYFKAFCVEERLFD